MAQMQWHTPSDAKGSKCTRRKNQLTVQKVWQPSLQWLNQTRKKLKQKKKAKTMAQAKKAKTTINLSCMLPMHSVFADSVIPFA